MAKHRKSKARAARKATLTGVAVAGISGALVAGHATNVTAMSSVVDLANTVIGVGGLGDDTGARVPPKLSGTVVPEGYTYQGLQYDSGLNLAASRDAAIPLLNTAILDADDGQKIIVVGYSAGTLAVEQERRNLQQLDSSAAPSPEQLSFVQIASPFAPNGGIFARFPGIPLPGIVDAMGGGQPTRYDTTYVANEYDPYADFPAYFNPVSLLNSALAMRYAHPDEAYNPLIPGTSPAYVTTVQHTVAGTNTTDTYVLYYRALPLLAPLRQLATMTGLTPFSEPFISAVEPLLRLVVDMGYTDRVNANPCTTVPFSFITPPQNVITALAGVPGAISQGVTNLLSGGTAPTALPNPLGNLVPAPPAPSVEPQVKSSQARLSLVADSPTPTSTPEPVITASPTVTASTPSAPTSTPPTTTSNSTEATSHTSGDGLHPTLTSDGTKAVPGGTGKATGSGSSTGGTTTTTSTATTTEPTTESTGAAGTAGAGETGSGTAPKDAAA
ncbi:PE-PPE domain-containing protein [Mycobacterium yunnanensis]|uniref:PE-PPE domain-containing protein n=1 Tax=Mycobacterium yunnanensis TaxID=368477 RepID=A0A9X3C3C4_9MYCO|nr:PE-PPE domain-containing protein [Mycobacterium yunnanensis]MCV7424178.1 PE-PPE domain-containing protein [Mycobacterium yunnanensis]